MASNRVVLLLILAAAAVGFGGWAAEDGGLSGTVGVEAAFLPGFSTDVWLSLDWQLDGWSFTDLTEVSVFPTFGVSWTGSVGYSFGPVDLGGTVAIDVYPFAFTGFDLSAGVGLLDVAQDGFKASADASLYVGIYPAFDSTLSLDVDASYGVFSLGVDVDLGVPGFALSVLLSGEIRVLDLSVGDGSLTADLGASASVVPAGDAQAWFNLELDMGALTLTSETDFDLTPFGLTEQRIEIDVAFDGLSIYVWGSFTGAGDLSVGIGATYDFP